MEDSKLLEELEELRIAVSNISSKIFFLKHEIRKRKEENERNDYQIGRDGGVIIPC
jgi:hypothetical protein